MDAAKGVALKAGQPGGGAPTLAPKSEHTQWLVDQEVAAILAKAETHARDLLTSHRDALDRLTAALLEQETVTGDQVRAIARAATPASLPAGTPYLCRTASPCPCRPGPPCPCRPAPVSGNRP